MKKISVISTLTASLLLVGCGDSSSSSNTNTEDMQKTIGIGYYVDSAVAGINYECGSQIGVTDSLGKFSFEKDQNCTFKLGNIVLRDINGTSLEDNITILEDNKDVAKLLQSFDKDGDPSNGIEILPEVHEVMNEQNLSKVPTDTTELVELVDKVKEKKPKEFEGEVVTNEEVETHLDNTRQRLETSGVKTQYDVEEENIKNDSDTKRPETSNASNSDTKGPETSNSLDSDTKGPETSNGSDSETKRPETSNGSDAEMQREIKKVSIGYYVDSAVEGVDFNCTTQSGTTDENGTFTFEDNESCTFTIGNVLLREVNASSLEDNVTIFEDNTKVAQLLQTLDSDGNASNGIEILPEAHDVLKERNITKVPKYDSDLVDIKDDLKIKASERYHGDIVSEQDAREHLEETRKKIEEHNQRTQNDVKAIRDAEREGEKSDREAMSESHEDANQTRNSNEERVLNRESNQERTAEQEAMSESHENANQTRNSNEERISNR